MCLMHQETCCSSLVLKPWKLDQETSEKKPFTKTGQIARQLRIDSSTTARQIAVYQGLDSYGQIAIYRELRNQNCQIWFSAHAYVFV